MDPLLLAFVVFIGVTGLVGAVSFLVIAPKEQSGKPEGWED